MGKKEERKEGRKEGICSQESRNERKLEEGEPVEQRRQNTNKHQHTSTKLLTSSPPRERASSRSLLQGSLKVGDGFRGMWKLVSPEPLVMISVVSDPGDEILSFSVALACA